MSPAIASSTAAGPASRKAPLSVVTYTRDQLLALAHSPLSQAVPDSPSLNKIPNILKRGGGALSVAAFNQKSQDSD